MKSSNFEDETFVFLMLVRGIFQQKPLAFIESLWGCYKETYIKCHFKIP
jgi:hypothetical protein